MNEPGFKQFRSEGFHTYLVFDPNQREGILVSPRLDDLSDYREFIHEHGLKLNYCLDLGYPGEGPSGVAETCREFGCDTGQNQTVLNYGARSLKKIPLPGPSASSMGLLGAGFLLSGEVLLVGMVGKLDPKLGGSVESYIESLKKLAALPKETVVFPQRDPSELLFTTIGVELTRNATMMAAARGDHRTVAELFRDGLPPRSEGSQAVSAITVQKYEPKIKAGGTGTLFLDVREPDGFQAGHFPGARLLPLSHLAFHLDELRSAQRIYFSCKSGRRSLAAAKTLAYLGAPDAVNVTGGYQAWCSAGLPVET